MTSGLLSRYFGFEAPVDRRMYLRAGVLLMILKYVVDAGAIWLVTHQVWTPVDYLFPLLTWRAPKVSAFPVWLSTALILWTLPFTWVGVSLTLRRAIDAGKSPWYCLLFFLPGLNYLVMLWLATLPSSSTEWRRSPIVVSAAGRLRSALLGIAASAGIGVVTVAFATLFMRSYGLSLFVATPFVLGAVTAFIHNHDHPRSARETEGVVVLSVALVGGTLMLFALEGLACILMAAPLGIVAAVLGGMVGRLVAIQTRVPPTSTAYLFLLLPAATLADRAEPAPPVYEAITSIVVAAPADSVWEHVIRFSDITAEPSLPFRLGIAYPMRAVITGAGVGAVRHCEFSTGAFVEPITVWDAPHRLSFGVTSQPPALRELSPYRHVYAPHVKGFFKAQRGEFRLVPLAGGRTRLEGSTWYTLQLYPQGYWRPIAEWLLTRIHERVLQQVKTESESAAGVSANDVHTR